MGFVSKWTQKVGIMSPKYFFPSQKFIVMNSLVYSFGTMFFFFYSYFSKAYMLLVAGWAVFCLQKCLNYLWHKFNTMLLQYFQFQLWDWLCCVEIWWLWRPQWSHHHIQGTILWWAEIWDRGVIHLEGEELKNMGIVSNNGYSRLYDLHDA